MTYKGGLCDPLLLRSQLQRLLNEHWNSSQLDKNDKVAAKDKVAIADSLKKISVIAAI